MRECKQFYINGEWVDPVTPNALDVINPATEEVCAQISLGSEEDVDRAVNAARAAFASFSRTSVAERVELLENCVEVYKKYYADIAEAIRLEMGAPNSLAMAAQARACSLDWGESVEDVLECLDADKKERFDVVVAADCCYQPWLQPRLLQSIYQLMSNEGVALLPFALHGNAKDEEVWRVVDRAKDQGFRVQILQPQQLAPPVANMDLKQGLVQTVRLTKK